jgi:hypothetical protein
MYLGAFSDESSGCLDFPFGGFTETETVSWDIPYCQQRSDFAVKLSV